MFAAFDLREQPEGEVVVVNETDDGFAVFERVARGPSAPARRDRRPGLGGDDAQPRPDRRPRPAAHRLAPRQRAAAREDRRGARGDGPRDRDGRADDGRDVTPLVVPGVSMAELVEAVEHELRARRLALPVVRDAHLHRPRRRRLRLRRPATARRPDPGGHVGDVRLRRRRRRLLLRLRPHDLLRRAARRLPRGLRGHARRPGGRTRGRVRRHAGARGQRRLPRADRGGRPRRALPPPDGPRHRAWTSTSGRSSRPRTRRRSSPG